MQVTQTTQEAMTVLRKHRHPHIETARGVADELIAARGKTNTGEVYAVMDRRGLIDHTISQYWLGAVFRSSKYKWLGTTTTGKGHDKLAKEWAFA